MGAMVDYLKNSSRAHYLYEMDEYSDEEIEKVMRKCFRYAQDKAKEQFKEWLIEKKKNEKAQKAQVPSQMRPGQAGNRGGAARRVNNVDLEGGA